MTDNSTMVVVETSTKKSKMDKRSKVIVVILSVVLVFCIGVMAWLLLDKFVLTNDMDEDATTVQDGDDGDPVTKNTIDESDGSGKRVKFPDLRLTEEDFLPITDDDKQYGPAVSYGIGFHSDGFGNLLRVTLSTVLPEQVTKCKRGDSTVGVTLTALVNYTYLERDAPIEADAKDLVSVPVEGIDANDVVDVMVAGIGQEVSGIFVLFLMKDGTIEYVPIRTIVDERKVHSLGKIPGVENVIDLEQVSSSGCTGGQLTVIARTIDGKFYDLGSWATENR